MEYDLTTLVEMPQDIPMYVNLSILQDISRGVHCLHTQSPPVIHRALSSNNVLLNSDFVVKICDFRSTQTISQPLEQMMELQILYPQRQIIMVILTMDYH